jgi:hypothetical protein
MLPAEIGVASAAPAQRSALSSLALTLASDLQHHPKLFYCIMSGNVGKIAAERNQKALMELAMRPGNGECRLNSIRRL